MEEEEEEEGSVGLPRGLTILLLQQHPQCQGRDRGCLATARDIRPRGGGPAGTQRALCRGAAQPLREPLRVALCLQGSSWGFFVVTAVVSR